MPQAIANPEDLERFASELKRFNGQLAESMSRLSGQFSRLGDTWRDQEKSSPRNSSRRCACFISLCAPLSNTSPFYSARRNACANT